MISEFESADLKRYANLFYDYRNVNCWSSPECMKQSKKVQDPTVEMDVFSFGVLMWEIMHDQKPFDENLKAAIKCVLTDDVRPAIHVEGEENNVDEELDSPHETVKTPCSPQIATLIRQCWQTDP